jgi:lactate dehydrogenase-like 2-hydroxyacid dehydrogenase|tara:strand:- start:258 stop:1214 length:957 start_codon:yes stop_codon:yes gene_type:complete
MKPKIIVTRNIPVEVESKLKEYFQVSFNREDKVFSKDTLRKAMENADGIVCTVTDNITNDLLSTTNKKVKIIANIGVGVDHIDLQSARENNVIITNTPDVLTEATVDVATLLLLSVTRNAFLVEKMLRQGEWKGFSLTENLGVDVRGKILGIVGMGRIGKAFAKRAHEVFGMKILYYNRSPVRDLTFEASVRFDLDALLEESDVISLHLSSDERNKNIISKSRMKKIKASSFLINTSRGDVIDQTALIDLLEKKKISGAGLDVFLNEPNVPLSLRQLSNVTLYPHIGSATYETRTKMGMLAVENLMAFFNEKEVINQL